MGDSDVIAHTTKNMPYLLKRMSLPTNLIFKKLVRAERVKLLLLLRLVSLLSATSKPVTFFKVVWRDYYSIFYQRIVAFDVIVVLCPTLNRYVI